MEQFGRDNLESSYWSEYLEARNNVMLRVTFNSVRWVVERVNNLLGRPVDNLENQTKAVENSEPETAPEDATK